MYYIQRLGNHATNHQLNKMQTEFPQKDFYQLY